MVLGELDQSDKASARREFKGKQPVEDSGRFGLTLQELSPAQLRETGLKFGLLIVEATGAAAKAGLQEGDVIVGMGSQDLTSLNQFKQRLAALKAGESVPLRIVRNGQSLYLMMKTPEK